MDPATRLHLVAAFLALVPTGQALAWTCVPTLEIHPHAGSTVPSNAQIRVTYLLDHEPWLREADTRELVPTVNTSDSHGGRLGRQGWVRWTLVPEALLVPGQTYEVMIGPGPSPYGPWLLTATDQIDLDPPEAPAIGGCHRSYDASGYSPSRGFQYVLDGGDDEFLEYGSQGFWAFGDPGRAEPVTIWTNMECAEHPTASALIASAVDAAGNRSEPVMIDSKEHCPDRAIPRDTGTPSSEPARDTGLPLADPVYPDDPHICGCSARPSPLGMGWLVLVGGLLATRHR